VKPSPTHNPAKKATQQQESTTLFEILFLSYFFTSSKTKQNKTKKQ